MRAGTGQKTGRDDCRDPASTILSSRSVFCVYMEPGRFSCMYVCIFLFKVGIYKRK